MRGRAGRARRTVARLGALGALAIGLGTLAACTPPVVAAACAGNLGTVVAGPVAQTDLDEISGLVAGRSTPDAWWAVNDSGGGPHLYAVAPDGSTRHTVTLEGVDAVDWEDLAAGPGPEALQTHLYVADIGDNSRRRAEIVVYRFPEPVVDGPGSTTLPDVDELRLRYPDGAHDAEALVVDPRTGDLLIIVKSGTGGPVGVYRAPPDLADGSLTTLTLVATLNLGAGGGYAVTGADVTGIGDVVIVRTYGAVLLWTRLPGEPLWSVFERSACAGLVTPEAQGETVAFDADQLGYTTISEGTNPAINRFLVPSA